MTPPITRVLVFSEAEAVAQVATGMVIEAAKMAVHARGRFLLALSGGSTPRRLYQILASPACDSALPWEQTHLFWSDERCVPADDPRSNYRLVEEAGLLRRPVAATHRMPGELPPEAGAARYEEELAGLGTADVPGGPGLDLGGTANAAGIPGVASSVILDWTLCCWVLVRMGIRPPCSPARRCWKSGSGGWRSHPAPTACGGSHSRPGRWGRRGACCSW